MAYGDLKVRNLIWNTGSGDNTVVLSTLATQSYVTTNFAPKANPTFTGTVNGADLTLSGNLVVNGTTTTINTQTLDVEDINITLGKVSSPSDTTANNGGITLKGSTDKTFNWLNATDSWTSSEHIEIASGKNLKVDGTTFFVDGTNNRVGIGLTAPVTNFHVKAASPILRLEDSTDPQGAGGSIGKIEFYGNDGSSGGVDVRSYIQTISTNATGNSHALTIGIGAVNNSPTEVLRVDDAGRLLLGTTTEGHSGADDLTISNTASGADMGITLRSATNGQGAIYFSDGTSGADEYRGYVNYNHSVNALSFASNATTALTLDSSQNATFAGDVTLTGGSKFVAGSSAELEIYHSTYSRIAADDLRIVDKANGHGMITAAAGGAVGLRYANNQKIATTNTGVSVTGTVTATSFSGSGANLTNLPAAGGTITSTAHGTIAANAPVIVRSDGKVSTITGVSASFSSQANSGIALDLGSGSYSDNCHYFSADYDPTDNKICAAWYEDRGQNELYAIIGTVSGTSVTWGSKVTVYSGESSAWIKCCWAQPGVVMVAYDRTNTTRARYISTSGNNGTLNSGGECTIIGYNSQYGDLKRTSNNGKCFVTYNHSQTGKAEIQQLYINGASISNSGGSNLDSSAYNHYARLHYAASKNAMIVTFLPNGGTYNGRGTLMLVANANTTSFTYKSSDKVYLNGGHDNDVQQPVPAWDPDNERMLIMYGNDSSGVPRSVEIGQITGSGSSVVPSLSGTRLDAGGDEANHETKFYYDSYKKKFIAAYKNVYDSKFMYRTYELNAALDGVTMSSAIVISSTGGLANNSYQTALEMVNISNAKWFTLFGIDSPAGGGTGQAYIQKRILDFGSTDLTTGNCIGFSSAGYSDGNTATINVVGNTITQSSLTAGQKYYVQSNGTLSTTADTPSVEAGIALSSTKLLIRG